MEWEAGVSRYKLLHIERINKVLLYSTENHIQHPMINHMEKILKKNNVGICVCVYIHTHTHN